ncbi:MAG: hypothetical protein HPY90_15000 [Syntrophothermus sp.]|uniref:hypothetical protein n=1 Tax=Syntrophothermus sp. TaxID=2736299 RepID=UPI00257CBD6E|nr:hypothetical protein [Syntrophothermus sp.]NSW84517.1 hypothetical protein [Syntrophothermus sp.]
MTPELIGELIGESIPIAILLLFIVRKGFKPYSRSGAIAFAAISAVIACAFFSSVDLSEPISNNLFI